MVQQHQQRRKLDLFKVFIGLGLLVWLYINFSFGSLSSSERHWASNSGIRSSSVDVTLTASRDLLPHKCRDIYSDAERFRLKFAFDANNRFVELGEARWNMIHERNPFKCHTSSKLYMRKIGVPQWSFERKKLKHRFGGFTADMGWNLMVARFLLQEGKTDGQFDGMQFMRRWGHGCPNFTTTDYGWTCFFQEITPDYCIKDESVAVRLNNRDQDTRHRIKMYQYYDDQNPDLALTRNANILKLAGVDSILRSDNDLQTMRILFGWIYQLQNHTRFEVDKLKRKVFPFPTTSAYIAMHIRWGDKIGRGGGPKESSFIPLERYIEALHCHYSHSNQENVPKILYIATDDYASVTEMQQLLPYFTIYTSATPKSTGFSITNYHSKEFTQHEKFLQGVQLWADMELLANAQVVVGNLDSNILKTVHLMRRDFHPDTTINVFTVAHNGRSCCNHKEGMNLNGKKANCFWLCTS